MSDRTPRTPKSARAPDWAPRFLAEFERVGMVSEAAKLAGIGRRTAYDRRERDKAFAREWDDIVDRTTEIMERAAYMRGTIGVEKPVFQGGQLVGRVREYSDALLMFMLKSRRPSVYRERHTVEHTGSVEQRVKLDLRRLTDEQLAALEAIQPDAEISGSAKPD